MFAKVLFLSFITLIVGQSAQDEAIFKQILQTLCTPDLPPAKAASVGQCDKNLPKAYMDVFAACAKETLGVPELTLPMVCYRAFPNNEQLTACLLQKGKDAEAAGLSIPQEVKDKFKAQYMECMTSNL